MIETEENNHRLVARIVDISTSKSPYRRLARDTHTPKTLNLEMRRRRDLRISLDNVQLVDRL